MVELLQQPSTILLAIAIAMLVTILATIRALDRRHRRDVSVEASRATDGLGVPPLPRSGLVPLQRIAAIGCCVLAIFAGVVATMVDARWFGHDQYRLVALPAACLVVGCGLGAVAALYASAPERMRSKFSMVVQIGFGLLAFGFAGCGGLVMLGMLRRRSAAPAAATFRPPVRTVRSPAADATTARTRPVDAGAKTRA